MTHQQSRYMRHQRGFIGSFDWQWCEWSWLTDPDQDQPKEEGHKEDQVLSIKLKSKKNKRNFEWDPSTPTTVEYEFVCTSFRRLSWYYTLRNRRLNISLSSLIISLVCATSFISFGKTLWLALLVSRLWTPLNVFLGLQTGCAPGLCVWKSVDAFSLCWDDSLGTKNRRRELLRTPDVSVTDDRDPREADASVTWLWSSPSWDSWFSRGTEQITSSWLPFVVWICTLPSSKVACLGNVSFKEFSLSCWNVTQVNSGVSL